MATVSSEDLARGRRASTPPNSARTCPTSGSYGTRGVGYDVQYLIYQISRELGLTQDWAVAIVGVGNLGRALANYGGFVSRGFRVAALVDADPEVVGDRIAGLNVEHIDELEAVIRAAGSVDRGDRHTGRGGPAGVRPGHRRGRHQHPQLRPRRALGAGRRRCPKSRPIDRAADPRVPRAAQSGTRRGRGRAARRGARSPAAATEAGPPGGRRDRRGDPNCPPAADDGRAGRRRWAGGNRTSGENRTGGGRTRQRDGTATRRGGAT